MNHEELDSQLDEWLDRATREYGRAETRRGFESRIIAKLNSRLDKRRWLPLGIPVAAAAAAILLFCVYFLRTELQDRWAADIASNKPQHMSPMPVPTVQKKNDKAPVIQAANADSVVKQVRRQSSNKQRGRFLSSGLSDQERYLIAFAKTASNHEITGLSDNHNFEQLQIPELGIPPFIIPEFKIPTLEIEALLASTGIEETL
jgi:hypothetical protein